MKKYIGLILIVATLLMFVVGCSEKYEVHELVIEYTDKEVYLYFYTKEDIDAAIDMIETCGKWIEMSSDVRLNTEGILFLHKKQVEVTTSQINNSIEQFIEFDKSE